jgi:hypothetical protein
MLPARNWLLRYVFNLAAPKKMLVSPRRGSTVLECLPTLPARGLAAPPPGWANLFSRLTALQIRGQTDPFPPKDHLSRHRPHEITRPQHSIDSILNGDELRGRAQLLPASVAVVHCGRQALDAPGKDFAKFFEHFAVNQGVGS